MLSAAPNTLYFMNYLPYKIYMNPAMQPICGTFVELPTISTISVSAGNITVKSKKTALMALGTLNLKGGLIDIITDNPPLSAAQTDIGRDALITVNGQPYKP